MIASLDGFVIDKSIPLEIKNVGDEDYFIAKKGKNPNKYYPQVKHQIACLNVDLLHYFSYRDGDFALVEVERGHAYIDRLYLEEARFWDLVLNLEAPNCLFLKKKKRNISALIAKGRAAGQSAKGSEVCLTKKG